MRKLLAILCFLYSFSAHALTSSDHALRIEDTKDGNIILGAEKAKMERGEIYHTIVLLWGQLDIYGEVDEVLVLSGHVVFHEGSKVNKNLVVMGGSFESQPGAQVAAESVVAKVPGPAWRMLRSVMNVWRDNIDWVAKFVGGLFTCVMLWLLGWALFQAFPKLQANVVDQLASQWPKNLLLGFVGSIGSCVIFAMLIVSILGIVLIPFYLLTLLFAAAISYMAAALWTGHRLLPPKAGKKINPLGYLLGFIALQFLWTIPVWWAGIPVIVLWTIGWGSVVRSLRLLWR